MKKHLFMLPMDSRGDCGFCGRSCLDEIHVSVVADKTANSDLAWKFREIADKLERNSKPLDEVDAEVIRKHLWELYG